MTAPGAEPALVTDAAREWIGRTVTYEPVHVTETDIHKFCLATGSPVPERHHGDDPTEPMVAPLSFYLAVRLGVPNLVDRTDLARDGTVRSGPPIAAARVMAGGTAVEFVTPIRAGDEVAMQTTYEDVYVKQGSSGELAFVKMRHQFEAAGRILVIEHYTRIFAR